MSVKEEFYLTQERKLVELRKQGINPFPSISKRNTSCEKALKDFRKIGLKKKIVVAGRIKLLRLHGGSCFLNINDGTSGFQLFISKKEIGKAKYQLLKLFEVGDIIETAGRLFKTKRGEKTLFVKDLKLLSKALRPLPEKWHGLKDVEERFRFRELDLLTNPEVKKKFLIRARLIQEIRRYLEDEGFVEVETPVLQVIPGGASAKPFITHHKAFNIDMYLRVAPELYLKRLIVGGFEKVFEIGKQFRNEGVDHEHNPEFTSCEFYWSYQNYEGLMKFTEKMLSKIIKKITGGYTVLYEDTKLNFKPPWPRYSYHHLIKKETGVDILKLKDADALRTAIEKKGFKTERNADYAKLVDNLYKEAVRPKLIRPCFLIEPPIELEPLAKKKEGDERLVERFQLLVHGFELLKAYSELNDPVDQLDRFKKQQTLREKGDEEAQFIDRDFIRSLEQGLPPTAGWGLGIDRLVAILTNSHSLREVILFPTMKSKE